MSQFVIVEKTLWYYINRNIFLLNAIQYLEEEMGKGGAHVHPLLLHELVVRLVPVPLVGIITEAIANKEKNQGVKGKIGSKEETLDGEKQEPWYNI